MCDIAQKIEMSRREETLTAIQNVAVCVFIIGFIMFAGAMNIITIMIGAASVVIGGSGVFVLDIMLDRVRKEEEENGRTRKKAS